MRSRTPLSLEGHCSRCYLRQENCLCAALPRLPTSTEVIIVRHVAESRLTSNTGRLAALCLPNSRVIDYEGGLAFDASAIRSSHCHLLYPGAPTATPCENIRQIVVLDATYRQARRMFKRIDALRSLPILSLSAPLHAPHRLRQPPHPDGMSTIEAIAEALDLLEPPSVRSSLYQAYAAFVERSDRQRGRIRSTPNTAGACPADSETQI